MHLDNLETDNFSSLPPSLRPFQPPPSYARMYTAEQGTQVAGASRSLARPSHPVIPRCLLGFSWLRIVRAQCFPTSTKLSQNSLSTAKVSFSLLREIANEKWRLHRNAHFKFRAGGRAWCAAHFFPGPGTPCSNASSVHQCLMMAAEDGRRRLKGRIEAPPVGRPHPIHPGRGRSLAYVRTE